MKTSAVLFLLLPAFPLFRAASPVRYLRIFSSLITSLITMVSVLYGLLLGSKFLCLKINHSGVLKR